MKKAVGVFLCCVLLFITGCSKNTNETFSDISSVDIYANVNVDGLIEWTQENIKTFYPEANVTFSELDNYSFEFDSDSVIAFSISGPIFIEKDGSTLEETFIAAGRKKEDGKYYIMIVDVGGEIIYTSSEFQTQKGLTLVEHELEENDYSTYIVGEVKNDSSTNYNYLSISFSIYDDDGNKIGTALDNIGGLAPGETWSFKAYVFESENMDDYKLDELSGF